MPLTVFGAQGANNDVELWGTDGTTGRTFLIRNINPSGSANVGNASVNSSNGALPFAVIGNYAYFTATDGTTGQELWRTDGTTAGTTKVTEFSTNGGTAGDPNDDIFGYNPQNIVAANGFIFFIGSGPAAVDPATSPARYGIWKYDPGTGFTSFIGGDNNDSPVEMIAVGTRIYWTFDGGAGSGLSTSDGVAAAQNLVATGSFDAPPSALYAVGTTVYLGIGGIGGSAGIKKVDGTTVTNLTGEPAGPFGFGQTSSHVYIFSPTNELFVTTTGTTTAAEITAAGLSFDFYSGGPGSHTPGFAALGNKLIFSNNKTGSSGIGASTGSEVWITGGATDGSDTALLKDIVPGLGSSNPHNFITVGSSVFFQATNGNGSVELWKTDGTAAGTVLIDTIFAGGISPGGGSIITTLNLENMRVSNGVLYFSFDDQVHGSELWRSDGTAAGTLMVKDLNTGFFDQGFAITSQGANLGATGVFVGWNQAAGYELFVTNGTVGGTGLLKDIAPGGGSSMPAQFTVAGTKAYFTAFSPAAGIELWVTDGTAAGTVMLKDVNPGLGSGNPGGMVAVGNKIYFSADNGVNGQELWVSDGTAAGTVMLKDIDATFSGGSPRSGSPGGFVAAGSNVFFIASTNTTGRELWVTDGTQAGTHIAADIFAGAGDANIYEVFAYNGRAYFQATGSGAASLGSELWVSDGITTMVVKDLNLEPNGTGGTNGSAPSNFVLANNLFFFRAQTTSGVNDVYVSDGTVPGTVAVSSGLSNVGTLVAAGNKVFFTAQGAGGQELYVTSGGAAALIDIVPGPSGSNAMNPVAFGTKILFQAQNTAANGIELWISDGTTTQMLKNINATASGSSNPTSFVIVGNKAYFVANDGVNGAELWVTDGTGPGTVLVKNIGAGGTDGQIQPIRAVDNGHLLFLASDGTTGGQELWITNGTDVGTFRVTDVIQPGGSFFGSSGGTLNGGGALPGSFTSVPGVTLGGGDETFVGTADNDYFDGLGGNDIFYVNSPGDVIREAAASGNDVVYASVTYALTAGAHVETLSTSALGATTAINLIGNELAQLIYGNAGVNSLNGGGGNDTLLGFGGNDVLNGSTGNDTTNGGAGNDAHHVDAAGDVVQEAAGGGSDIVYASVSYALTGGAEVETMSTSAQGATTALNLTGNAFGQVIYGNAGANVLNGGGGNDTMIGLGGNDVYHVDAAGDAVHESAASGNDVVYASATYTLTAGAHVETLSTSALGGTAAINLIGNELVQVIYGNAGVNSLNGGGGNDTLVGLGGNDILNGSTGNDMMNGGAGNDAYHVDAAGDVVQDAAGGGSDIVYASVSYTLAAAAEVETLSTNALGAVTAINLTGNATGQVIYGNAGANVLNGLGGNDTLVGLGGADIFAFTTALGAGNIDAISGYSVADDTIRLENAVFTGLAAGALAAGAFNTGAAASQADDRIIYNSATGALLFDADGVGGAAAVQFAALSAGLAMTAGDFVVI